MKKLTLTVLLIATLVLSACGSTATVQTPAAPSAPQAPAKTEAPAAPANTQALAAPAAGSQVEITIWDFYGDTTPIKPLIPLFEKENPGIKVKFEEVGWDGFWQKLPIAISSGEVPDVVTTGLMWAPEYKVSGAYLDVMPLSKGVINGKKFEEVMPKGMLDAARDGDKVYGVPFDFDAYALYYRADLFEAAGIKEIPGTWDDLAKAFKKVSDPAKGVYGGTFDASWNAWDPYLYAFGGQYVDESGKAVFNSPEAVASLKFVQQMIADKSVMFQSADTGDATTLVKSGQIASFANGPYMMGVLRTSAPELSGKWKVAKLPTQNGKFGTHIGGVHLSIMAKSKHPAEAWKFVEFLARTDSEISVWKTSGAAPAQLDALASADVTAPDPYFSNQAAITIFKETVNAGRPNPTIKEWTKVSTIVSDALAKIFVGNEDVQKTLDAAVAAANKELGK
jgi:multiple sugar transport system substrate-binding protein